MKFVFEQPIERHTFADVKRNQFFVCLEGDLWQRLGDHSAIKLAASDGIPDADYDNTWADNMPIFRILPIVTKIEF